MDIIRQRNLSDVLRVTQDAAKLVTIFSGVVAVDSGQIAWVGDDYLTLHRQGTEGIRIYPFYSITRIDIDEPAT